MLSTLLRYVGIFALPGRGAVLIAVATSLGKAPPPTMSAVTAGLYEPRLPPLHKNSLA